jgi:hypothetical protein
MKTLLSLALLLSSATTAFANFSRTTSFEGCTTSTRFACGMFDDHGRRFGTAQVITHCEKYSFLPNATYYVNGALSGTYQMIGQTVRMTPLVDGKPGKPFDMTLSTDGSKLGEMKLVR